jgi:hypothetical protein
MADESGLDFKMEFPQGQRGSAVSSIASMRQDELSQRLGHRMIKHNLKKVLLFPSLASETFLHIHINEFHFSYTIYSRMLKDYLYAMIFLYLIILSNTLQGVSI